jgi:hypothetical protein
LINAPRLSHNPTVLEALDLPEIEEVEPFYDPSRDEADDESML